MALFICHLSLRNGANPAMTNEQWKMNNESALKFLLDCLLHLPLLDAGRPILLHRDFEAQPRRRYGFESELIKAVLLDAVSIGCLDRLPGLAIFVEESPGGGRSALAAARVVVPIDLGFGDGGGLLEGVFHPFRRALLGPPVEIDI